MPANLTPAQRFAVYFDVADEIYGDGGSNGDNLTLTLDDLDVQWLAIAREVATELGLPWPPYLPAAEDYRLANIEWCDGKPGW